MFNSKRLKPVAVNNYDTKIITGVVLKMYYYKCATYVVIFIILMCNLICVCVY